MPSGLSICSRTKKVEPMAFCLLFFLAQFVFCFLSLSLCAFQVFAILGIAKSKAGSGCARMIFC